MHPIKQKIDDQIQYTLERLLMHDDQLRHVIYLLVWLTRESEKAKYFPPDPEKLKRITAYMAECEKKFIAWKNS